MTSGSQSDTGYDVHRSPRLTCMVREHQHGNQPVKYLSIWLHLISKYLYTGEGMTAPLTAAAVQQEAPLNKKRKR